MNHKVHISFDAKIKQKVSFQVKDLVQRVKYLMTLMCDFPSEVTLRFCDRDEISQLNHQFRKKNKATDVLSFPTHPQDHAFSSEDFRQPVVSLGDVAICVPVCAEQISSPRFLCQELERMVIHGLVHLRGFDHERSEEAWTVMSTLERALKKSLHRQLDKPIWAQWKVKK